MPHTLLVCQLSTISKKKWKIREKLSNFDNDNKSHFLHLLRFRICSSILCSNFILFLLQQLQLYYYMQKVASAGMGNPKERKECPICSKTLYDRSTWNRHMRIHTGMCISFKTFFQTRGHARFARIPLLVRLGDSSILWVARTSQISRIFQGHKWPLKLIF